MLKKYFSATKERNTFKKHVAAPYIRKSFNIDQIDGEYTLDISVVGIYDLYVNGYRISKGRLLPYRTNPNHIVYVDTYRLNECLVPGENVIGIMLGNGFSNSIFRCWDFDRLSWAHSPKIALEVKQNNKVIFDMSSFKCHPSEVVFDDFHCGEHIDANKYLDGWDRQGFDDSRWDNMIEVESPKGELLPHPNFYPTIYGAVKPEKVIKGKDCYLYDFGMSFTAVYKLKIRGEKGKTIRLFMSDGIREDKTIFTDEISAFGELPMEYRQFDWFTLSGGDDEFENRFSYKSGRYIALIGISDEEAETIELEAYKVSSIPNEVSHFECDNEIINGIQQLTINSDKSNFFYFPTDCPHREKNGWTGDATLSAEQMLINFNCLNQFKAWLRNIVKAQNKEGTIPGIVPTDTWGFAWGNGPGWDTVLFELPYRAYVYSGDKEFLVIVHEPIIKYLAYMKTKENEKGLFKFGLGDWLPARSHTPVEIVDSIIYKAHCDLAEKIFDVLGDKENSKKARDYSDYIKKNFNEHYPVNFDNRYFNQTWGAMSLYYDMYDGEQKEQAKQALMYAIECQNEFIEFGVLANRCFWRVLAEMNETDLAIKMLTQDGNFSFKKFLDYKATTLFEAFIYFDGTVEHLPMFVPNSTISMNHHFWGDVSAFFYRHLAGLQINNPFELTFSPSFTKYVKKVDANIKDIRVHMEKVRNGYDVSLYVPANYKAKLAVPKGYKCSVNELKEGLNNFKYVKD